jgi:Domain of unknown function (DUF1707)
MCQYPAMNTQPADRELFLVRIGDAEREACVEALVDHHVLGRLTTTEFQRRQDASMNATTAADLALLLADLPANVPSARTLTHPAAEGQQRLKRAAKVLGPIGAVTATAVIATDQLGVIGEGGVVAALLAGAVGYLSRWFVARHHE